MRDRLATLDEIDAEVWRQLGLCTKDKGHPWRVCVLATLNGELADARLVVLREVDERRRQLLVYTDERDTRTSGYPGLKNRAFVVKVTRFFRV